MHHKYTPIPMLTQEETERFWSYVDTSGGPDACWEWQASRGSLGYGKFNIMRHPYRAHRVAYAITHGGSLSTVVIRHAVCDNPPCCNPAHLADGTITDNNRDITAKGRHYSQTHPEEYREARLHLRPPHHFGETAPMAKLTEDQVRHIRSLYASGKFTQKQLARQFGVGKTTIGAIVLRQSWAHVK